MNKKGQLTIFILMGLVLLIAGAFVIYINQKPAVEAPALLVTDTFTPIESMIHDCWQRAAERAISRIGVYGGTLAPEVVGAPWLFRVGVKDGRNTVPSAADMENELSYGAGVFAQECEQRIYPQLTQSGASVTLGKLDVKSRISERSVRIEFNGDHTMTKGTLSRRVSPKSILINSPLGRLAAWANYLAQGVAVRGLIDVFAVSTQGINVTVYAGPTSVGAVTLVQEENYPNISGRFLLAFDQTGEEPKYPPVVKPIPSINAAPNVPSSGLIVAIDPLQGPLQYTSYNNLVQVQEDTGVYQVNPTANDVGTHPAIFKITNARNITTSIATQVIVR